MNKTKKISVLQYILWVFEGIFVGFGAILPGISGGALLVAFGMYRPIIEVVSDFKSGFKKHFFMLLTFFIGVGIGFVGLAGVADFLMEKNLEIVTCFFIGFIIGTVPELWGDAGKEGRNKFSIVSMVACFAVMLTILLILKRENLVTVKPNVAGFILCGVLWGLSFIVPGLSSSSLLLFFGIYQPMLDGISTLDFSVLIPLGLSALVCVLLLSKIIGVAFKKFYSVMSHAVLGFVLATTVVLLPGFRVSGLNIFLYIISIIAGAIISYFFSLLCARLKKSAEEKENLQTAETVENAEKCDSDDEINN